MPLDEIEYHPYLEESFFPINEKLILGSFPVYAVTNPDTAKKRQIRTSKEAFRFFYGSAYSSFWELYRTHVDTYLNPPFSPEELKKSVKKCAISISDLYQTASRVDYSSLDQDLRNMVLNENQLRQYIHGSVEKVLCTSKKVMEVLSINVLEREGYCLHKSATDKLVDYILQKTGGDERNMVNPISKVYTKGSKQIDLLSIPSPGSFQRSVQHFGWLEGDKVAYGHRYFEAAFSWLKS